MFSRHTDSWSSSEFDWSLEIIQDSEKPEVPQILRSYIANSLNNVLTELTDPLGLDYPNIALRKPTEFEVRSVVVRSVFQYQITHTANTVEIAIYREWRGCDTKKAPTIQASVSMLNPNWDDEMMSIENSTASERRWDRDMSNFFGGEGTSNIRQGLPSLITDIREVQKLLSAGIAELQAAAADEEREQEEEEYLQHQIRQIEEDEADERRQKEVTEKAEEKNAVNKPATIVTPTPAKPTTKHSFVGYIGNFDDQPAPDGSLI